MLAHVRLDVRASQARPWQGRIRQVALLVEGLQEHVVIKRGLLQHREGGSGTCTAMI